jgi:pSer/pThr/pTyr-binding forkhead associated (FHA) protein
MATRKHSEAQGGTAKISNKAELIIGRAGSTGLDIEIANELVSGKHLRIFKLGGMVIVEDLGSTNGTTLDGIALQAGVQKPIDFNSKIMLAETERVDFDNALIRVLFEGISTSSMNSEEGTRKQSGVHTPIKEHDSNVHVHRFDKFYPPSYTLEEEKSCRGKNETIMLRVFSKDTELRVIVFGEESQDLIFNEERSFSTQLDNIRDATERRNFIKQEIENLLYLHKERYCQEEIWHHVLTTDAVYKDGGFVKLVSEKFENRLKTKVYINDKHFKRTNEEERLEFEDSELIAIRAKEIHEELMLKYGESEEALEFPVSVSWLNSILEKIPYFYKKSPMSAFWVFLFSLFFILWLAICLSGKFMNPKINQKTTMAMIYFGSIEEPLCGNLEDKCNEAHEMGWPAKEAKKRCKKYCAYQVVGKDSCMQMGFRSEKDSSTPFIQQPYQIIPPSQSMGSNTSDGIILFINNTSTEIVIKLETIKVDGQDFPGIILPISGKDKFILEKKEQGYRYDIMFEPTSIGQLQKGSYPCEVSFKVKIGEEEPHLKSIQFNLEI